MKQKILLSFFLGALILSTQAQKNQQRTTAYAITATQKGNSNWTEVKLIDVATGEEVQPVYESSKEIPVLNARTGKPVVKKDINNKSFTVVSGDNGKSTLINARELRVVNADRVEVAPPPPPTPPTPPGELSAREKIEARAKERIIIRMNNENGLVPGRRINNDNNIIVNDNSNNKDNFTKRVIVYRGPSSHSNMVQTDKPFATNSAACAYDKKHDRLYYTPLGINQLRYIDLKSNTSCAYYFEDEPFGALASRWDVPNQITRMVIGADGNGYALTNNAEHLIRFTTNKKAEITDLGALMDDAENTLSVRSKNGYGGDIVAGESGKLYLITANRAVFAIDVKTLTAKYLGAITGLPRGYSTNGAIVDKETSVIVSSAQSTSGYYKFDLKTLQAEKVSAGETVFNASDLANGNLLKDKSKKNEEQQLVNTNSQPLVATTQADRFNAGNGLQQYKMSVYPNPVTNGTVNLLFADYPNGKYQVQFMDVSGKIFTSQIVNVNNKNQVQGFKLPQLMGKGNYLVKIVGGEANAVMGVEQIVVQ